MKTLSMRPSWGAVRSAIPCVPKFPRFRCGQQPKLREMDCYWVTGLGRRVVGWRAPPSLGRAATGQGKWEIRETEEARTLKALRRSLAAGWL